MKQKELLLWVVAIAALALSLIAVIGPKGLKSDAAMRPATMMQYDQGQSSGVLNADSVKTCTSRARAQYRTCMDNAINEDQEDACYEEYNVQKFICRNQNNVPIENQN